MKLALISDIHGNRAALEAVLADIEARDVARIINLGDCLSGPLDAVGTAEILMSLNLPTVLGNHDRQLLDRSAEEMGLWEAWIINDLQDHQINWLKNFQRIVTYENTLFCHGTPDSDEDMWLHTEGPQNRMVNRDLSGIIERLKGTSAALIGCGHTHTPALVRLPSGPTIVNPGSVGVPAFADTRADPPFIHQMGSPDARYAIVEKVNDTWCANFISVPYDPAEMAALARTKGAEDWARALETGWLA
ncbi:MAG: metallophosphoesterase family protein [Boseongicola sp.]|nr:metallophosphoesterase family protein [Boseongicola sp.]